MTPLKVSIAASVACVISAAAWALSARRVGTRDRFDTTFTVPRTPGCMASWYRYVPARRNLSV